MTEAEEVALYAAKEIRARDERIAELEAQLKREADDGEEEVARLERRIRKLEDKVDDKDETISSLESQIDGLSDELGQPVIICAACYHDIRGEVVCLDCARKA